MMPIAMIIGIVFYKHLEWLSFITPYLLAVMLFFSYCNISIREIRPQPLHIRLLFIQIIGCIIVYILLSFFDSIVAQGVMICILAPTATSAVVITGMLGGNITSLTTYSLLSNMAVALCAPLIFACIGAGLSASFLDTFIIIAQKVFVLLILPLIGSLLLKLVSPYLHMKVKQNQGLSFYLWSLALIIVTSKTVQFIMLQDKTEYKTELLIALFSMLICFAQFLIGRWLGNKYSDTVAGGQGLGQKNTILAIWMAQTYLIPIASIGPGAYILWQNIVNSYQVWQRMRNDRVPN